MNQKITIEKVDNGYILSYFESEMEFSDIPDEFGKELFVEMKHGKQLKKEVIEEDEVTDNISEDGEKQAMTKLLFRIAEFFGIQYDKWKDDNLEITWSKKGHKL